MIFFLDSSVFIESKKNYYAPDICSAFWCWLSKECLSNSNIRSIQDVLDELKAGNDDLPKWVQTKLPGDFFIPTSKDVDIVDERRRMQDALEHRTDLKSAKVRSFLAKADLWLIAAAKIKGGCVVTNERANPGQGSIKIPSVAEYFGVKSCTIFDVMRTCGVRLCNYDTEGEKQDIVFKDCRAVVTKIPSLFNHNSGLSQDEPELD